MSSEIVSSIHALARSDSRAWAAHVARLGLIQGAGTSLRASHPGWTDETVDPDHAAALLSHPDAHPDDGMRTFRSAVFRARLTIIARNGVIGCVAQHDDDDLVVCDDLSAAEWRSREVLAA
jgi:hypothetical protein